MLITISGGLLFKGAILIATEVAAYVKLGTPWRSPHVTNRTLFPPEPTGPTGPTELSSLGQVIPSFVTQRSLI
jgi:hypothetical protein